MHLEAEAFHLMTKWIERYRQQAGRNTTQIEALPDVPAIRITRDFDAPVEQVFRPQERLVQTFTWEGEPDGVSLETMSFEDLGGGRTRTVGLSVVESFQTRDLILASGMDTGIVEGHEKLDELLA